MAPADVRPYRRRQWIVNRPLQFRFVKVLLLLLVGLSLIALASVYLTLWATLHTFGLQHDPVAIALFLNVGWSFTLQLLIVGPFVVWTGILLTHKVAGPLVRIQAALEQMTHGDFDVALALRKGDSLRELADVVTRLAASLRSRGS